MHLAAEQGHVVKMEGRQQYKLGWEGRLCNTLGETSGVVLSCCSTAC